MIHDPTQHIYENNSPLLVADYPALQGWLASVGSYDWITVQTKRDFRDFFTNSPPEPAQQQVGCIRFYLEYTFYMVDPGGALLTRGLNLKKWQEVKDQLVIGMHVLRTMHIGGENYQIQILHVVRLS